MEYLLLMKKKNGGESSVMITSLYNHIIDQRTRNLMALHMSTCSRQSFSQLIEPHRHSTKRRIKCTCVCAQTVRNLDNYKGNLKLIHSQHSY